MKTYYEHLVLHPAVISEYGVLPSTLECISATNEKQANTLLAEAISRGATDVSSMPHMWAEYKATEYGARESFNY